MHSAVNLLRSLDVFEQEYVAILLLEDIVENRIAVKGLEAKLADTEKTVADLRASLSTMRGAALQTAMEYRKEMDNLRNMAADKIASAVASENCSQAKETQRDPNFSRSKSSLFSFDEYGAATPKLQKMFDSAYGRGFVVLKPSLRRVMSGFVEPVAAEEVVRGAEEALRKEVTTGDDVADEESSDGHSRQTSPIRKSLSVDKLVLNSPKLEGRLGGKYSPELYQVEPNGLEVDLSAESQSSDFESSGRGRTMLLQSPIKALRAASVPPSPLVAGSDKAIIHNFINLRRRKISIKPSEDSLDLRIPPETTSAAVVGVTDGNIEENNGQFKKIQNHHGGLRPLTVPNMRLYDYEDSLPESGEHKKIVKATDGSTIDSLSGGGDVFSRLATSHTLASQAKVIHREKEGAEGHNVDGSVQRKLSIVNAGATGAK
ncbi:hypothetical protein HDU82_000163 [Entophlyctis luteolus]|nr:hypothetical protein HDU82_000163 [Entophlyctis luteolus]